MNKSNLSILGFSFTPQLKEHFRVRKISFLLKFITLALLVAGCLLREVAAGGFPCDSKYENKKTTIYIHGETHDNIFYNVIKSLRIQESIKGKYFLGLEGLSYPTKSDLYEYIPFEMNESSKVFGIENSQSYALSVAVNTYIQLNNILLKGEGTIAPIVDENLRWLFSTFITNDYLKQAWINAKNAHPLQSNESKQPTGIRLFDQALKLSKKDIKENFQKEISHPFWENPFEVLEDLKELIGFYLATMKSTNDTSIKKEELECDLKSMLDQSPMDAIKKVVLDWRNIDFGTNILALYCKAVEDGKDLRVIVGSLHVEGLVSTLETLTAGTVPINKF